jgi:hypothetical protein
VKKCASCTKDLPDAALHCVFCGAKQPPAPAVQQSMAKTAFGYSATDAVEQLRQQGIPPGVPQGRPMPPAAQAPTYNPPPFSPPRPGPTPMAPPMAPPGPAPRLHPPSAPPPYPAPGPGPGPAPGFVPASPANAATMYISNGPPQAQQPTMQPPPPAYGRSNQPAAMMPTLVPSAPPPFQPPQPLQPQPLQPQPQPRVSAAAPIMPIPAAQPPPYLASQTASRTIRPIEPWKDTLRLEMFVWGVVLLAAFATPLQTSPSLVFNWNLILDGEGTARLPPLLIAAVGLLSLIGAAIPMQPVARGLIATVLGLAGIVVPIALIGSVPPWQLLAPMIGTLLIVPGLLVRNEYRSAWIPRILVTLGAAGILLPFLMPQNGAIPLVNLFKTLIDAPGSAKVEPALELGLITIVVMSLLAWLPAPVTGGAKIWAWLLILWGLITHATMLALAGNLGDAVTSKPNEVAVSWIFGGELAMGAAYLVLVGYGLASVIGKQLE